MLTRDEILKEVNKAFEIGKETGICKDDGLFTSLNSAFNPTYLSENTELKLNYYKNIEDNNV